MKNKILIICIFMLLLVSFVNAFGVSTFYYEGNPLILNPGDSRDVQLILQKEPATAPVSVKAEIMSGSDIAQLTGKSMYYITGNVPVNLKITIPETAKIGEEYSVSVQFTTTQAAEKGKMMGFGTQITTGIPIVIGKVVEPQKSLVQLLHLGKLGPAAIILILILIVIFLIRSFKKFPKKK